MGAILLILVVFVLVRGTEKELVYCTLLFFVMMVNSIVLIHGYILFDILA